MADSEALKNMVLSLRVSELQVLLGFAGQSKFGKKNELQARAVNLIRRNSVPIKMKIMELYDSIQQGHTSGTLNAAPAADNSNEMASRRNAAATRQPQLRPMYPTYTAQPPMPQMAMPRPNLYPMPVYNPYQQPSITQPQVSVTTSYPLCPDVKLKKLPFYDVLGVLVKTSSLVPQGSQRPQEANFVFHLTPQQSSDIALNRDMRPGSKLDYLIQVQVRFCLLETTTEQDDCFPSGIALKVNGKTCTLPAAIPPNRPGVEPKRPPRPVNVTNCVKISPIVTNHITVQWNPEFGRMFTISANLVKKLTADDLLQRLRLRGFRPTEYTKGIIKDKLNEDQEGEIATTSLRVSLMCPLMKTRMIFPCRATTCNHLQCFDAKAYLNMNERKPTWMCPVCSMSCLFDNLMLDGYFQDVLQSQGLPEDALEIQLMQDGSWTAMSVKEEVPSSSSKMVVHSEIIADDVDEVVGAGSGGGDGCCVRGVGPGEGDGGHRPDAERRGGGDAASGCRARPGACTDAGVGAGQGARPAVAHHASDGQATDAGPCGAGCRRRRLGRAHRLDVTAVHPRDRPLLRCTAVTCLFKRNKLLTIN